MNSINCRTNSSVWLVTGRAVAFLSLCCAVFHAGVVPASAAELTIETFDAPNSTRTVPVGINANGAITGFYGDARTGRIRGFLRDDWGAMTVFNAAGSEYTAPAAINSGGTIAGAVRPVGGKLMGFIRKPNGGIVAFDTAAGVLEPNAINDAGVVAGKIFKSDPVSGALTQAGFVRDRQGRITIFSPTGATSVSGVSINRTGQISGSFVDKNGEQGFVRDRLGVFTVFTVPSAKSTRPAGINAAGQIGGVYSVDSGGSGWVDHGFLREPNGLLIFIDVPGAILTAVNAINDFGEVTGICRLSSQDTIRGFIRRDDGTFILFDPPNSTRTDPRSLSLNSDVSGVFKDSKQADKERGFVVWVEK